MKVVGIRKRIWCVVIAWLLSYGGVFAQENHQPWTWFYEQKITPAIQGIGQKTYFVMNKTGVPLFNQVIFSWNAFRPPEGYFSFHIQVRNALTKKWGSWHKMIDWGAHIQKSYASKSDGFARYLHVQLKTLKESYADGFRIGIKACDGASMQLLQGIGINIANMSKFKSEKSKSLVNLPSVYVANVPAKSQMNLAHPRAHALCSPTSCSILASFLVKRKIDPISFAELALDKGLNQFGSWPFNMAQAFVACKGKWHFATVRLESFSKLYAQLKRKIPVPVSVRGSLTGAPKSYPDGHLLVVVGWDARTKRVICHDPACGQDDKTRKAYPINDFLLAWERSQRLAYITDPMKDIIRLL